MSVVVQFDVKGLKKSREDVNKFRKDLTGLGSAANDASRGGFSRFQDRMLGVSRSLERGADRLSSFGRNIQSTGRRLSFGLTLPLAAAGAGLIKFAADTVESENLFEVAMGDMADEARTFSKELRAQLGLNEFAVREQIGTFFQMTNAMGLSREAAFSMSTGLVQLTNDMASFFNLRPEVAFQKLQAGITGEVEPLKRLGIIINETTIQQAALNAGLIQQGQQLTEQQKVMARYIAIVNQTENAQGDLARTLDSPTNQMRLLTQELKQQAIELGQSLLPIFQAFLSNVARPAVTTFGNLVESFQNLTPRTQGLAVGMAALAAATGPVMFVMGGLLRISGLMLGAKGLAGLIRFIAGGTMAAAVASMGKLVAVGAGFSAMLLGGVAAGRLFKNFFASGDFNKALEDTQQEFTNVFSGLTDTVSNQLGSLKDTVSGLVTSDSDSMTKNMEGFAEETRKQMQESAQVVSGFFGEAQQDADELFKSQVKHSEKLRRLEEKRQRVVSDVMDSINDLSEERARREIRDIEKTTRFDLRAQRKRLFAARDRFQQMGADGVTAVNLIDRELRDLEEQIKDRTFGEGVRQAIGEFTQDANNLGRVAKDVVGGAFRGMRDTLSQFIQTGKLSFGDLIDTMKRQIANFLASQVVSRFLQFFLGGGGLGFAGGALAGGGGGGLGSALIGGAAQGAAAKAVGGGGGGLLSGVTGGAPLLSGLSSPALGSFLAGSAAKLGAGPGLTAALGNIGLSAPGGLLGGLAANLLGLGGGTGGAVGGVAGGIGGALAGAKIGAIGGPLGSAIGAFAGTALGGLFNDPDFPFGKAQIAVTNGSAKIHSLHVLDEGDRGAIKQMGQAVVDTFNSTLEQLGITGGFPGFQFSVGTASGRPGSALGQGFFAGAPGTFAGGAQFTGLESARAAVDAALQFALSKVPGAREEFGLRQFQTGGTGIFTRPSLISVAETEPEKVDIRRLGGRSSNEGLTVVLQGPNVLDDISANRFARVIERSLSKRQRRGL